MHGYALRLYLPKNRFGRKDSHDDGQENHGAHLPIDGSAELAERFYRQLISWGHPAASLAGARRRAYDRDGPAWSVPVLIARSSKRIRGAARSRGLIGLPERRSTYLERPRTEADVLAGLTDGRLVSLVGLPGIGKTQIGREAARQAVERSLVARVVYREATAGMETGTLRSLLGTDLGAVEPPGDDGALAALFEAAADSTLLVIDNAEVLMRPDVDQAAFRAQIDTLLSRSQRLRILLTTRWPVEATRENECQVAVFPMTKEETSRLMAQELRGLGVRSEAWLESRAWSELLDLIDGHPLSLWLISGQLANQRTTLEKVRDRLVFLRNQAAVELDLLGRPDKFAALEPDTKARLRSLVACMDLSFEVLEQRHPEAVEAFVALSLFPGGLPESVAREVTGGLESLALDHLHHDHLIDRHDERTFYPAPLHWYAERKRNDGAIDENLYRCRALLGFADFAESCDRRIYEGSVVDGVRKLLSEQVTLKGLAAGPRNCLSDRRSERARIATAVSYGLMLAKEFETVEILIRAGIDEARAFEDHRGEANCQESLGDLEMRLSDFDAARESYAASLAIYREIRDRLGEANCLGKLGDLEKRLSDLDAAREFYSAALLIYREIQSRLGEANCLKGLGDLEKRLSNLEGARESYSAALLIYREIRNRLGEASCLKRLGDLEKRLSDLDATRESYSAALLIYREIRNRLGEANCLKGLGDLEKRLSDLEGARESYSAALLIYREIRNRLGEANCLKGLGDLEKRLSDLEGARESYSAALLIYREIQSRLGEANCLKKLGDLEIQLSDLAAAQEAYSAAIPVYREIRNRRGELDCLLFLGLCELASGQVKAAFSSFLRVLERYRKGHHRAGEQASLGYLARVAQVAGQAEQALLLAEKSLELSRALNYPNGQTANLDLQLSVWLKAEATLPALAAMLLYRDLGHPIKDEPSAERYAILENALASLPDDLRKALEADPERIRQEAIREAEERFREEGRDLFALP